MAPQFAVGRSLRSEPATDEDAMSDDTTSLGNVIRIQLKLGKHVPMGHRPRAWAAARVVASVAQSRLVGPSCMPRLLLAARSGLLLGANKSPPPYQLDHASLPGLRPRDHIDSHDPLAPRAHHAFASIGIVPAWGKCF